MDATKLPKTLRKYAAIIADYEDATANQNGHWVYLIYGLQNRCDPGCHQMHEDTLKQCASLLSDVIPCHCAECCGNAKESAHA